MMMMGLNSRRTTRRLKLTGGSAYATMRDLDLGPFPDRFPVGGNSSGGYLAGIETGDRLADLGVSVWGQSSILTSQMLTS